MKVPGDEGDRHQGRPDPVPDGALLELLTAGLDREASMPLNVQIRGVVEYGIVMGTLAPGTRLPTVRDFAESTGVATMTVVSVYRKLKKAGLIETRGKAGTFVAAGQGRLAHESLHRLNRAIDDLLHMGRSLGIDAAQVAELTGVRGNLQRARATMPLRVLFVGLFAAATADYARFIREKFAQTDHFDAVTVDRLVASGPPSGYDLVLTLVNHRLDVRALIPAEIPVAGVNFVPSAETRSRLAGLDPASRVGIVSTFPEFAGLMRLNVLRFIPHVTSADITAVDAPDLPDFVRRVDVVVYATGSDRVVEMLGGRQRAIEYRHSPDPNTIENNILPLFEEIRAAKLLTRKTS